MRQHFARPAGSPPVMGYSHTVRCSGELVIISGQVPLDAQGNLVGKDDPTAQIRQVFRNLLSALEGAGAGIADLVKLTVFLTDIADVGAFREVRDEFITVDTPPASSLVQVSALINPEFVVEVEAMAVI